MISALHAMTVLLGLAAAQDGGKLAWKGKTEEPRAAMAEAKRQSKPVLLFFTSEGCGPCRDLSAGAFSDSKVVEASETFACIFVDCAWGKKNQELSDAFGIKSYPTVILCDPEGRGFGILAERQPERVAAALSAFAAKHSGEPALPAFPEFSAAWLAEARKSARPLLIYFHDDSPGSASVHAALADPLLRESLRKLVLTKSAWKRGSPDVERFDVDRAPLILVLDPSLAKPEDKPLARIVGSRSARELLRDFEGILSPAGSPAPRGAAPSTPPPPKREEEVLTDDELERQFIQANLFLAKEWLRKGDKAKAAEMLQDLIKSYPNHVAVREARKLLDETLRK